MLTLRTAIGNDGYTKGIKDGSISPKDTLLDHVEITPLSGTFKRMVPVADLDLAEMVFSHYLIARDHGIPFTAIPVFPARQFHHSAATCNVGAGIASPKDLEGKRIGVRTYGFSRSFWLRGVLAEEYGVDLEKITWVVGQGEALAQYEPPPNVEVNPGTDLGKMLESGELDAGVGVATSEGSAAVRPLFENAQALEADWYRKTGVYPMSHVLVLRNELVEANPELPLNVFLAFKEAKTRFLEELDSGAGFERAEEGLSAIRAVVGPDPIPYGLEQNKATVEMVLRQGMQQHFTSKLFTSDELFDPSTTDLT